MTSNPSQLTERGRFLAFAFVAAALVASILTLLSIFLDIPFVVIPAGTFAAISVFLIQRPLPLLSLLIVARMSLDFLGDTTAIPLGKNLSLSLSQMLGIEVILLGTISVLRLRKHLSGFPFITPIFLMVGWGTFSLLFSINSASTIQELLRVSSVFILSAFAFSVVQTIEDFRKILFAFFASSILPIAVGLYQFVFSIGFQDESVSIPRIYGTFSHPNVFSLYLFSLIALAFLSFLTFARTPKEKFLFIMLLSSYSIMLMLTYTRIAWIVLFAFFFFLAVFRFRRMLAPLLFVPVLLFFFIVPFQERISDAIRLSPDSSLAWRFGIWSDGVNATLRSGSFFVGSGMNTFSEVLENIRGLSRGPSNDPHNDFVKFFVEGGIVGLIVLSAYCVIIGKKLFQAMVDSKSEISRTNFLFLLTLFASLLLASLSDNVFKNTPVQWIFWIATGAAFKIFASPDGIQAKEKPTTLALRE